MKGVSPELKKLIETALPLSAINKDSCREWTGSPGHPANLHPWWGRSPIETMKQLLLAATKDCKIDRDDLIRCSDELNADVIAQSLDNVSIFDPFSGSGCILIAAQKVGIDGFASDINPVSVMITKAATEIPARFADCPPVNTHHNMAEYNGAKGLAEDISYYGELMFEKAKEKLAYLYPSEEDNIPSAWIWNRTVKCPNPACGCQMPLITSNVICSRKGHEVWAEPVLENSEFTYVLHSGICPTTLNGNKHSKQKSNFICPACNETVNENYIRGEGIAGRIGSNLMAVCLDSNKGRLYVEPNNKQRLAAKVSIPEFIPEGDLPQNVKVFSPIGFGYKYFSDLYTPRQLTMLTTFCDILADIQNQVVSDAIASGMSSEGISLADGGTGSLAYGQAVRVYLSFVIDRIAECNSAFSTWRTQEGNLRNTISHYAIPMPWTFAEGNPFSTITGNFKLILKSICRAVELLPCEGKTTVSIGDACTINYPRDVIVCTELPYYSDYDFSHLSDVFYIWMRRCLKNIYPDLFGPMLVPKEDLTTVSQYYGETKDKATEKYREKLKIIIKKLYAASSDSYPTLLFYKYTDLDEAIISKELDQVSSWETILQTLEDCGFIISALWPIRSTAHTISTEETRVLIVAKKQEKVGQITRRAVINTLKRELPDKIDLAICAGVDDCDKELIAMGCGLSILTQYKKVLNADGSAMSMHDALQIIYQEAKEFIDTNSEDESSDNAEMKGE